MFDFAFDALELNGRLTTKENKKFQRAVEVMDVPLIGGSDAHHIEQLNTIATEFPDEVHSVEEIINAIKMRTIEVRWLKKP